jgi:flagellar basal-body rod modification protein FlgD
MALTTTVAGQQVPLYDPTVKPDPVAKNTLGSTPEQIRASFISLLVASMQNQDPLNPTDSKDMTQQLAQIQSLESTEQMNTKLDALVKVIGASQGYGLMSAIGRFAKVEADSVSLDSAGAAASVVADAAYPTVQVTMTDSAGKVVATNTFSNVVAGDMDFTWGGLDPADREGKKRLPDGTYGISAVGVSANGTRVPLKVNPLLKVDAAINDAGDWKIKLGDGKTYAQSDLKGIY